MADRRYEKLIEIVGPAQRSFALPEAPSRYAAFKASFVRGPLGVVFADSLSALAQIIEQTHSSSVDETTVYDLDTDIVYTPVVIQTIQVTQFRPVNWLTASKMQAG